MKFLLIIILLSSTVYAQQDTRYIYPDFEFEKGSSELMYGDNVVLRAKPSKDAKALDTLSIGDAVTIVKKADESMEFNGLESSWYKVRHGRTTGYVLGGLIALDNVKIGGDTYLVIYAGTGEEYILAARCRVLKPDGEYYGHEVYLNTSAFSIEAFDSRGVEGIESMLCINLLAEACGVDGGTTYLFNNGERLIEAIHTSSVGDGGYWFAETLTFPEDPDGWEGIVQYERETGEPVNDEMTWSRSVVHHIILHWENDAFTPDIRKLDFGEE